MEYKKCPGCGGYFIPTDKRQVYCSKLCGKRARQKRWESGPKKAPAEKICPCCGKKFTAKTDQQKYCSKQCTVKASTAKRRARKKALHEKNSGVKPPAKNGERRVCPMCGKVYTTSEADCRWVYCSIACACASLKGDGNT